MTIVLASGLLSLAAEVVNYFLVDMRDIKLVSHHDPMLIQC